MFLKEGLPAVRTDLWGNAWRVNTLVIRQLPSLCERLVTALLLARVQNCRVLAPETEYNITYTVVKKKKETFCPKEGQNFHPLIKFKLRPEQINRKKKYIPYTGKKLKPCFRADSFFFFFF